VPIMATTAIATIHDAGSKKAELTIKHSRTPPDATAVHPTTANSCRMENWKRRRGEGWSGINPALMKS
jgi:hypothetical protein